MSTKDPNSATYYNIKKGNSATPIVDYSNSPELPGSKVRRPYVNIPVQDSDDSPPKQNSSRAPEKARTPKQDSPEKSHCARKSPSSGVKDTSPLRRHASETGLRSSKKTSFKSSILQDTSDSTSVPVEQAMSNAKFDLLLQQQQGGVAGKGCEKCDELMELLASWQIGAGSLMRNYGRILSLLIRTRDSALALECRLNEQSKSSPSLSNDTPGTTGAASSTAAGNTTAPAVVTNGDRNSVAASSSKDFIANGGSPTRHHHQQQQPKRANKNRQSMFVTTSGMAMASTTVRDHDLAENMYPKREEHIQAPSSPMTLAAAVNPSVYTKNLEELKKNLWDAIDMCQQLAAASFKKTHLGKNREKGGGGGGEDKSPSHSLFSLHPSVPSLSSSTPTSGFFRKHSEGTIIPTPQFKSSLQTISEEKKRKRQRTLERAPSAPSLECSGEGMSSSGELLCNLEDEYVHVSAEEIPAFVTKAIKADDEAQKEEGVQNGDCSQEAAAETHESNEAMREAPTEEYTIMAGDRESSADVETGSASDRGTSPATEDKDDRIESGRSESVLSAVSTYTDSDVKYVMTKIASLEEERYKLLETIDELHNENSTVRLSLHEIMEDLDNKDLQLTLAMQDLTIATEEIRKAADMRKKLKSLSGERDALLERLGALEDESSAVKVSLIHLLQEKSATNKTLALENWRLTQKQSGNRSSKNSTSDISAATPTSSAEDNVSIHSGFSAVVDDNAMQEAVMGADMIENFVHKQGFLVKQGGRVKNWRKRLFVLNTDGLSYYKTEQPIQTVPISRIEKVQVSHGRCPQPHMFEVHTHNRVFYLSASSADEMQSWVGMLETLKQYRRTATMHAKIMEKAKAKSAHTIAVGSQDSSVNDSDASKPRNRSCTSPEVMVNYSEEKDELQNGPSAKGLTSSNEEGDSGEEEEDEEHIILHQQLKGLPSQEDDDDDDDDATYVIGGANLSVPEGGGMMSKKKTTMSGKMIEGLDLSDL